MSTDENKSLQGVVRPPTVTGDTEKKSENSAQVAKVETGPKYDPPPMDVESQAENGQ